MATTDLLQATKEPLFRLQVDALLEEVRPDPPSLERVPTLLKKLQKLLQLLPPQKVDGKVASSFLEAAGLPLDLTLDFLPPEAVCLVGSFSSTSMAAPKLVVDVAVQIPSSCLHHKAYLNRKYWGYRALYLTVVAEALKARPMFSSQAWSTLSGDPYRPTLLITIQLESPHPPITMRLLPCIAPGTFPLAKFSPDRNNLRSVCQLANEREAKGAAADKGLKPAAQNDKGVKAAEKSKGKVGKANGQAKQQAVDEEGRPVVLLPTTQYNAAVLHDLLLTSHSDYVKAALSKDPKLVDALLLLKVWAHQWELSKHPGDLSGHTLLLLLLLQRAQTEAAMSPLQLFRSVMSVLANPTWHKQGLAMKLDPPPGLSADPPSLALMRQHYPIVIQDFTGWVNLAAGMLNAAAIQVEWCARHALKLLDGQLDADMAFRSLFLTPAALPSMFDYIWRVTCVPPQAPAAPHDQHPWRQQEGEVCEIMAQALGSRARLVRALPRSGPDGATRMQGVWKPASEYITVAVLMDAAQVTRVLDIGPPAADKAAARKFRDLWGEKSELRRFPDGTISEAVLWHTPAHKRHMIPDLAVKHLLQRRLGAKLQAVECSAGLLDSALEEKGVDGPVALEAQKLLDLALDQLGKLLRGVDGLVLKVLSVQPLSPSCTHTSAFCPLPNLVAGGSPLVGASSSSQLGRCMEAVEVLVQLEGSGRWPDEALPYCKTKAAIGVQLAKALEASKGDVVCQASEACVDVLMMGFAFRLLLATSREDTILAKLKPEDLHNPNSPLRHMAPMRHMNHRVWLRGLVGNVSGQHPAFAPSTRLAKRWVASQMLSNHLSDPIVELLMCAVFTPSAYFPCLPASRTCGFLRWLQLLSSYPWSHAPLVVDPLAELSYAQRSELQEAYLTGTGDRRPLHICTSQDPTSSWSESSPSRTALVRIVAVAAHSALTLQKLLSIGDSSGITDSPTSLPPLFVPSLNDFDLAISIAPTAVPFARRTVPKALSHAAGPDHALSHFAEAEAAEVEAEDGEPPSKRARSGVNLRAIPQKVLAKRGVAKLQQELLVGFHPLTRYIQELEARYGHIASFWVDGLGGDIVCVKWHSVAFLPTSLNVTAAHTALYCGLTCEQAWMGCSVPNTVQLIASMNTLGVGLVGSIRHCPKLLVSK